jgi:hypothetical protein
VRAPAGARRKTTKRIAVGGLKLTSERERFREREGKRDGRDQDSEV